MSPHDSKIFPHIDAGPGMTILDVAGLTVEFLTGPPRIPRLLCHAGDDPAWRCGSYPQPRQQDGQSPVSPARQPPMTWHA